MNIIIRYSIWITSFFFSYIIPKKKKLIIFGSVGWRSYSWNSKIMYEYFLKNNKEIEAYYMTRNKDLLEQNEIPNLIRIWSLKWFWLVLRAKLILTDCNCNDVTNWLAYQIWRFNFIDLCHWVWIKKMWLIWTKNSFSSNSTIRYLIKNFYKKSFLFWCITSPFSQEIYNSMIWVEKYIITWLPRNDALFIDDTNKNIFWNYNKIFLYAPTWRQWDEETILLSNNFFTEIDKYLKEKKYLLLLKYHPLTKNKQKIESENIIDISKMDYDIQPMLKISDVIISDYSSVHYDFMLRWKPVIFYIPDLEHYTTNVMDLVREYSELSIKESTAENEEQLISIIKNIEKIENLKEYKEKYEQLLNMFHTYKDWDSTKRVYNTIMNNLEWKK